MSIAGSQASHVVSSVRQPSATIVAVDDHFEQVPLRELRNFTSRVLDRVKKGAIIEVTERGRPVARLVPVEMDDLDQLRAMGLLEPREDPGDPLEIEPIELAPGLPLPSETLRAMRADER